MIIKNKNALGKLIRNTRLIKGLTSTQLANRSNMKQPVISEIENGKSNVKIETIVRVAEALGLALEIDFTDGSE